MAKSYNEFAYQSEKYNFVDTVTIAHVLLLQEVFTLLAALQKADSVTIEDDGITFVFTRGPTDILRLHDWLRLERTPPVFPWTSGPIPS